MRDYERHSSHVRKLDEISKNMVALLSFHERLRNKVSQSRSLNGLASPHAMAFAKTAVSQCCAPYSHSLSVCLYVSSLCRMIFKNLRKAIPTLPVVNSPTDITCEHSVSLDIRQPRVVSPSVVVSGTQ